MLTRCKNVFSVIAPAVSDGESLMTIEKKPHVRRERLLAQAKVAVGIRCSSIFFSFLLRLKLYVVGRWDYGLWRYKANLKVWKGGNYNAEI